jgi:hypothetical protein
MQPIRIRPEYTLVLRYDIRPGMQEMTYRYMAGEFVNKMQEMHLYMYKAWHVVYGSYPEWQVEFVTERLTYVKTLLASPQWEKMENRLQGYTDNYSRRVLPYASIVL